MSTRRATILMSSLVLAAAMALAALPASVAAAARPRNAQSAVCPAVPVRYARCLVHVVQPSPQKHGGSASNGAPTGYSPGTIASAYGFSTTGGAGETIAVVDAYGASTVTSNLQTFSSYYGLTCANCLTKVNQNGATSYPRSTAGWALEQSLDVEWAHALAPKAHVLLVEASSNSFTNLMAAVRYAAGHAQYVSMSWGGKEFSGEKTYDSNFTKSAASYFAAAGDSAAAVIYPSASPNVVSVGGTTLTLEKTGTWKESAWSTAGGGCSRYETATSAQAGYPTYDQKTANCSGRRATPDISLDANPSTGVSVYDTERVTGLSGWIQVGGTSASTVMVAAHAAETAATVNATYVYGSTINVYDVTTGSNGHPCEQGYDLCTGVGSWDTSVSRSTSGSSSTSSTGSLSFTSAATTLTAGNTAQLTVSASASSAASPSSVTVKLSSTSATGEFSTTPTPTSFTSSPTVTVTATSSKTVYYEDTTAGTPTLSATAAGWSTASRTVSVTAGSLFSMSVSPASVSLGVGASHTFSATGYDKYKNQVTNIDPSWSTTSLGSVSPSTGTSTTYTAGKTAGTAVVTAVTGAVHASARVKIVSTPFSVSVAPGTSVQHGPWYHTPLTVSVSEGTPVAGATVLLTIVSGSCTSVTAVATGSATTGSGGTVSFTFKTRTTGAYCAEVVATSGGSQATALQPFAVPYA